MKIRHLLFLLLALSAIAFMQPLVFFLGGLTLLLGVGALIYRDLSPAGQDAVERRVLGWLRRTRAGSPAENSSPALSVRHLSAALSEAGIPTERVRRARTKAARTDPAAAIPPRTFDPTDDPPAI
ncbi:MAG: hypothetical protein IPM89_04460 [Candidatus Competibacteraceae bacterium]|nr:MAG: hypothetical protein IPM89_04460 [Candidatus Competibacteraceae bacterium]